MSLYLTYEEVMKILSKIDREYSVLAEKGKFGSDQFGHAGRIHISKIRREITQYTKQKYGLENK